MVVYVIKNLLPIKDILKTISSSGINNYIKILQRLHSRKTMVNELGKMKKEKIVLRKVPAVLYLQNLVFGIKIFTNNKK